MNKKILVIDDHPETVRLIEMTLQRHGYEVVGVQSGAEGIERVQADRPDLVLLDVMMPDMDGLTVCRAIRAQEGFQDLPIVMFTAKTQVQDKKASFEAGADDYLTKPTRPAELISRVEAILGRTGTKVQDPDDLPASASAEESARFPAQNKGNGQTLVAVLGARGGAGATTVAVNLAFSLADGGYPTTLVDLDTRQGHVAVYLGHDVHQDVDTLLKQPPESLPGELDRYLVRHGQNLDLLLAGAQLGREDGGPPEERIVTLMEALQRREGAIVVDLGQNSGRRIYPLLQKASHVLICLSPERAAITATKQLIDRFGEVVSRPEKLHALMIDFGLVDNLPRRSVENFLGSPLLDVLQIHPQTIADAVNRDTPLIRIRAHSSQTEHFKRLARQFAPV